MEIVELVMRIEEEFDVDIPDGYAEKLTTIGHIEAYLAARLGTPEAEREALFQKLRAIVVDELSIPPNKVHRTARLVEDLDLD